jgi:hypothetical protein
MITQVCEIHDSYELKLLCDRAIANKETVTIERPHKESVSM